MAKAGQEAVDVTYTYDINSILEVEVTVVSTQLKKRLILKSDENTMSEEEIEKRLNELSELKIHPREQAENKLILAMGERIYEENVGEIREEAEYYLRIFEEVLDKQDRYEIEKVGKEIKEKFEALTLNNII